MAEAEKLQRLLSNPTVRRLMRWLTRQRRGGGCYLGDFFNAYAAGNAGPARNPRFAVPYALTEYIRRKVGATPETLRTRVFGNPATIHALVNTVRSVGRLGLTQPQQFCAPLMVVWNLTQACNLKCKHCYQDASRRMPGELTREEQMDIVDLLAERDVSMIAFSGGEPLMSPTFFDVASHAAGLGMHLTVATNGTLLTPDAVKRMVASGIRYAEVSIDSLDEKKHDAFRGQTGYWRRCVEGLRNIVKTEGIKSGLAMTVMRWNVGELEAAIEWAIAEGVDTFYAFNFIPTGRALDVTDMDLSPDQREGMLAILQKYLSSGRIALMSSAPQYGRACLEFGDPDGPVNTGHYGAGGGKMTRVLARYVGGCGAGRCYCAVQPDGKVTPCVFMPIEVGDLKKDSFEKIWFQNDVMQLLRDRDDRLGHCRICDFKFVCGGCRARSWGYFRDLHRSDPGCKFNRADWDALAVAGTHIPLQPAPVASGDLV